jgi:hypothetical protein
MSTYGFVAHNDFGDVLISSEVVTTHYGGTCTHVGYEQDTNRFTSFPGYSGGNNTLDGRVIHKYEYTNPYPQILFIRPANYDLGYAIISQSQGANNVWTILVLQWGSVSYPPTLMAFVAPWTLTVPPDEKWGLQVLSSTGVVYFDSRLYPLSVDESASISPPAIPCGSGTAPSHTSGMPWNSSALDYSFSAAGRWHTNPIVTNVAPSKLAFAVPSLTQAVYSRRMSGHKLSRSQSMYDSDQHHYSEALWWVMYRNLYKIDVASKQFVSGWGTHAAGYHFSSAWESGGWTGGSGGSVEYGSQPYTSKTINQGSSGYMLIDATRYL